MCSNHEVCVYSTLCRRAGVSRGRHNRGHGRQHFHRLAVPCQVAVILQVRVNGGFVPFRDTISDKQGRFRFERLPLGNGVVYQAGATRHGIHYPGPRIHLTDLQPAARTGLSVCDAVAGPNPLVLKKMDVTIRPERVCSKLPKHCFWKTRRTRVTSAKRPTKAPTR